MSSRNARRKWYQYKLFFNTRLSQSTICLFHGASIKQYVGSLANNRCEIVDNKTGCVTRLCSTKKLYIYKRRVTAHTYPLQNAAASKTMIYDFYRICNGNSLLFFHDFFKRFPKTFFLSPSTMNECKLTARKWASPRRFSTDWKKV